MEIDVVNITRNDLRVVVHGAVQMMYADGEVSYHEKIKRLFAIFTPRLISNIPSFSAIS